MVAKLLLILIAALPPAPEGIQPTGGKIGWCGEKDYDIALARAKRSGKPVLLYFTANWSGPDRALGAGAFSDDQVMEASWGFVRVVIPYVAEPKKNPAMDLVFAPLGSKPLPEQWAIKAFPTLIFLNPDGREVDRWTGHRDQQNPETIVQLFRRILAAHSRAPVWSDGLEAALQKSRTEAKPLLAFWTDGRAESEDMEAGFGGKELEDLRGKCVWVRLKLRRHSDPEAKRFEVEKAPVLLAIDPRGSERSSKVVGRFETGELDKLRTALEDSLKERNK